MQATVMGNYFLEERFDNFIPAVFQGFQISQILQLGRLLLMYTWLINSL